MQVWYVYIVRCSDGTLYTGVARDVDERVKRHNSGKGARYTRGRTPVRLVYRERVAGRGDALRRERQIKGMNRKLKKVLIEKGGAGTVTASTPG